MPNNENVVPNLHVGNGNKRTQDALQLGPRKKSHSTDPLVHHGRHFGRSVHALCNVQALINNGIIRTGERSKEPDEVFTSEERREHKVYLSLLKSVPGLEERLMNAISEEDVLSIRAMLQKGVSSARANDTKSLKSVIIDWITPPGRTLIPPIARNVKPTQGFNHEVTGALLCPTGVDWSDKEIKTTLRSGALAVSGEQWPVFLYKASAYDEEDPWNGLLRGSILVKMFKHIFTSPSSVDRASTATRSGNARIHGMTYVTSGSIAYVATQARFALSSSNVFSRTDIVSDSERFYNSILELLEDPDEVLEVDRLFLWWNSQIFPNYLSLHSRPICKDSALAKIRAKRAAAKQALISASNENGRST